MEVGDDVLVTAALAGIDVMASALVTLILLPCLSVGYVSVVSNLVYDLNTYVLVE